MSGFGGSCSKCGAPYWVPEVWHSIVPPSPSPTCACWNMPASYSSTSIEIPGGDPIREALIKMRRDMIEECAQTVESHYPHYNSGSSGPYCEATHVRWTGDPCTCAPRKLRALSPGKAASPKGPHDL